jgi:hypothetical protein
VAGKEANHHAEPLAQLRLLLHSPPVIAINDLRMVLELVYQGMSWGIDLTYNVNLI